MGQSARSKESADISGQAKQLYGQAGQDYGGFSYPYGISEQRSALDALNEQGMQDINRNAQEDVFGAQRGMAARLASQGITGGSIANQALSQQTSPIYRSKYNALQGLKTARLGQEQGLMNEENQRKYGLMAGKYNALASLLGGRSQAAQGLDDTTWFDDVLGSLTTAGNLAMGGGALFGKNGPFA